VSPLASTGYHLLSGQNAVAGQVEYMIRPTGPVVRLNQLGIVACHWYAGVNTDGMVSATGPEQAKAIAQLAKAGLPIISPAMHGASWGNDTSMGDITASIDYLSQRYRTHPTRAILYGTSMGAYAALRYAALNPTKVAAVVANLPLTNMPYAYTNNVAALGPSMGTAWGVTFPAALPGAADLQTLGPPPLLAAKTPVRLYYSTADAVVRPADVTSFVAAVGATASARVIDASLGHVDGALAGVNVPELITWLQSLDPINA
jgi:pimeloyl-ACP methyl ester carboxylesterase